MERTGGGLPLTQGLAAAAVPPLQQPDLSWEQLLDLPLDFAGELPAGLPNAAGKGNTGTPAEPEGLLLATQAQPTSPGLPSTLPATQPIASPLQQQLETLQTLEQMQQEQAARQALHERQEQEQWQQLQNAPPQPELLLLQTQLQDEGLSLADLLQEGLPESPKSAQQQQQQQQHALVPATGVQEQQAEGAPRQQQQQPSPAERQAPETREGEQQEQQVQQRACREPEEAPQQQQQQQQQHPEQAAAQPAARQGSADENEPAEGNSQEQPHARRRSARAAKRPAVTDTNGTAVEKDTAAMAPPGKRGRVAQRPRQRQQPHRAARAQHPVAEPSDTEADGREEAAAGAEEAVQLPPRPLLQEPPVPIDGVDSGLPPAPPRWEGHAPEPLTQQALAALAAQDAATHDQHLRLLRFDDRMAELASQSGLLVRFHVRTIRSYQAQAEVVVEAPEFLTVEYLKRRVARAKLQRGELLPTTRFVLRKKVHGSPPLGDDGTAAGPAAAGVGLEDLPSCTPVGDEVFLADLGYRAPGPYELCIASAPQTSDREQQESMLADLMVQAQAQQRQRQAAAAAAAAASRAAQPPELQNAALSYRALLQVAPSAPSAGDGGSGRSPSRRRRRSRASGGEGRPAAGDSPADAAAAAAGAAGNHSMGASAAGGRLSLNGDGERSRRQAGRWNAEEVAALIEGVQTHGTRWAQVYDAYVRKGRIGQQRTQVDLKDKWRNLVRLVTEPGKQARSIDLTEEQRQAILDVVFAKQAAGTPPSSAQRATPNRAAANGQDAAASGHIEPAAGTNGHTNGGMAASEHQQQQEHGSHGAGEVAEGLEGVPPPERQRNKRQRRKAAQAAGEQAAEEH